MNMYKRDDKNKKDVATAYIIRGVMKMATSSIFNNIKVTDRRFCRSLVRAMEYSKTNRGKDVVLSRKVEELNKNQIIEIFGDKNQ